MAQQNRKDSSEAPNALDTAAVLQPSSTTSKTYYEVLLAWYEYDNGNLRQFLFE